MTSVSAVDSQSILNNYIASQSANSTTSTSKSSSTSGVGNKEELWGSFDTFLNILTAQLKNQDPTSPMDASEFTNQLVQYAGVEQQISTNDKLDSLLGAVNSNGITPLLGYVGQYVEAPADGKLSVQGGTSKLAYTLPKEALSVTLYVKDSTGKTVATIDGPTSSGLNRVIWDGTLDTGAKASDGSYKFSLAAKDSAGETIEIKDIRMIGQVTGVETDSSGNVALKIGDISVDDADVKSVFAGIASSTTTTTGS